MEQVRDLLFGAQMKDMETHLKRQEEKFASDLADVHSALKTRLETLENFMKSEISSVLGRIAAEKNERESDRKDARRALDEAVKAELRERNEAVTQLAKDLAAAGEVFERKLGALSNTLDSTERELRELLLLESGSLTAKIEERYTQALDSLKRTSEQIRHDMVHRNMLSTLFTETAVKLSGQWTDDADEGISAPKRGGGK
jgi:hypothetical protein